MPSSSGKLQKGDFRMVAVTAASTANVADLTAATVVHDGVTLEENELVLLKNQTSTEENGVYKVGEVASALAIFTRHASFNEDFEAVGGYRVYINEGSVNAGDEYVMTTSSAIVLGTTSLTFTKRPTQAAATSLETRLSGAESVGELSSASIYTSLTTRVSTAESTELADITSADLAVSVGLSIDVATDASLAVIDSTNLSTEVADVASIDTAISSLIASIDA